MFLFIYRMPLWLIGVICVISGMVWAKLKDAIAVEHSPSFSKRCHIWKFLNAFVLIISIIAIATITLKRGQSDQAIILEPLISFKEAKLQPEIYRAMLMNVALFVPFGLSASQLLPRRIPDAIKLICTALIGAIFSITIEYCQYRFYLGTTEIDDVICNTFGALLGSTVIIWPYAFRWIRKQKFYDKKLSNYLSVTFSVTFICWGLLSAFTSHEAYFSFRHPICATLHILGGFSPVLGALVADGQKFSLRQIFNIYKHYKKDSVNILIMFAVSEIFVFSVSSLKFNQSLPWYLAPIVFVQAVLIYGGNEEIGWRGTMQPILEKHFPFPVATILTGIIWSIWHIPLWFVPGASQQNMPFVLFAILGIIISFWLAALYHKTESILFCSIIHGLTNTLLSLFIIKVNFILVFGLIALTIYSVYLYYNKN